MESVILFTSVAFFSLLFFLIKNIFSSKRVPPGSLGLPIIGQTLELVNAMKAGKIEEWLQERARIYGPISKLRFLTTRTVFLSGPAYNKFIYTSNDKTLSNRQPRTLRMLFGKRNLFEMSGEDHKRMRAAISTFLKPEALKHYVEKMDQEIRLHLNQHWRGTHQISVAPLMKTLTFNVICTLIFGVERGVRRDALLHLFKQVIEGMLGMPINLPFTRFNRSLRAREKISGILRELIHEKREKLEKLDQKQESSGDQDLITILITMRDEAGSPLLTDDEIEDNCALVMIAGHGTTSALLTVMVKLLDEHPHVHEAVLNEQEEIMRGKKILNDPLTWDDLSKMKYTWRMATESMRMYPPAMLSFRQVLQDIEIGGYVIPKGWQVLWAGCMTHLDESIYPDPYKFNPSRYEDSIAIPPHSFIAFGGGPRMCPGIEFARIETLTMIHYLVTRFKWKLCLEENSMSRDPIPSFKQGLPIQIEIRRPLDGVM